MTAPVKVEGDGPISVVGVTIEHNTVPWRVAKNRHPNIGGTDWGWIEGAPGNVCWSDNERFNRAAASEAVRLHNQWLEDQKPLSIRRIEAMDRWRNAKAKYAAAKEQFDRAAAVLDKCAQDLAALKEQQP